MKAKGKTKQCTYTIYLRQYNRIDELVKNGEFLSKAAVVRQALDFFFTFPFMKQLAKKLTKEELKAEIEKIQAQNPMEEFYNARILRILDKEIES